MGNLQGKIKILFLAANPSDSARLGLDDEIREIENNLESAKLREKFQLIQKHALTPDLLHKVVLNEEADIIHFSGHGKGNISASNSISQKMRNIIPKNASPNDSGIILKDATGRSKVVGIDAIVELLELRKETIQCVILNCCYSESLAKELVKHVPFVIGTENAISDQAAIEFSIGFYRALGSGEYFEEAFLWGRSKVNIEGIKDSDVLKIHRNQELIQRIAEEEEKSTWEKSPSSPKLPLKKYLTELDIYNCNRISQRLAFREFLQEHQTDCQSLFYFIPGDERQQVNSFIRVLTEEVLRLEADNLMRERAIVKRLDMRENGKSSFLFWNTLKSSQTNFMSILQQRTGISLAGKFSMEEIAELNPIKCNTYVVIDFRIYSQHWNDQSIGFFQWLIENCCRKSDKLSPTFIFLVGIIFQDEEQNMFDRLLKRKTRKTQILSQLEELPIPGHPITVLEELSTVEVSHLKEWFRKIYENALEIEEAIEKCFGKLSGSLDMALVEQRLNTIVKQYQIEKQRAAGL